ncbi:MAG: hypothetical protein EHM81_02395 [Chloroflexi bacterium]|nr:MAG: hypothetical protein EHM81_02395 [Chloroflexota bacterium]
MSQFPESTSSTCPGCGAPASTVICPYCGTLTAKVDDLEAERRALDAFHHLIATEKDKEKQGALFRHGFIPQHTPNLIEAGLRCATFTGGWNLSTSEPTTSALLRLRSLVIRLKIAPNTVEARRAIHEFEAILNRQSSIDRRALLTGLALVLAPVALVIGIIYWLVQLFR